MPSDSKTTDPRPTATKAATDEATRQAVQDAIENAVESLIDGTVEAARFLRWLAQDGYTVMPIAAAAPPSGRAACSTCGETGVDHDGFACRDCDGQGSTPIAAPPSGQVDCDAVATVLDGYFPPDIVAHIITEALAAAPPSGGDATARRVTP